jgi:hypothetical protein
MHHTAHIYRARHAVHEPSAQVEETVVKAQALKLVTTKNDKVKSYRLSYFNSRGLAEVTRYLFVLKDVPFEDKRYSFYEAARSDGRAWVSPDFEADKAAGRFPFGRLPLLEVEMEDGHVVGIAQSRSIERYVARKLGLMGSNDEEMAIVDMICDQVQPRPSSDEAWHCRPFGRLLSTVLNCCKTGVRRIVALFATGRRDRTGVEEAARGRGNRNFQRTGV